MVENILALKKRASAGLSKALSFLVFSAADERLRPRKAIALSIEKRAVGSCCASGFLFFRKIINSKRFETKANEYPAPADLASAAKSVLSNSAVGRWDAALVLPEEWIIQRRAEFPAAIKSDIPNAVAYSLDGLVPLGANNLLYDWRIEKEEQGKITLNISAVKLEKVTPYIEHLKTNGIQVSKLIYAGAGQSGAKWGAMEAMRPNSKIPNLINNGRRRASGFPMAGTAALLCLLLGIWVYRVTSPIGIEKNKIDALTNQMAIEKNKAGDTERILKEIGVLNGEIAAIQDFDMERPLAIRAIKELTIIIPKSAWLTGIKFSGDSIQIEGYAASATGLIPKLERSGYFSKAEFVTPTVRDAKTRSDHFVIKAQLNKRALSRSKETAKTAKGKFKTEK